jgi:dTDP-4-dehydrorhamnose 3,5-epimerase
VRIERPVTFEDERGRFAELYRAQAMPASFAQANHSFSRRGALRGLHWHRGQADLWYLVRGRAQVGLVDLRTPSDPPLAETFVLDADEPTVVYIPPGVAHGYLALTDIDLIYWVTSEYDPSDEHGIAWDDPRLGIAWQLDGAPIVSRRDRTNPPLEWEAVPAFS